MKIIIGKRYHIIYDHGLHEVLVLSEVYENREYLVRFLNDEGTEIIVRWIDFCEYLGD
jgi:hypothetical protein